MRILLGNNIHQDRTQYRDKEGHYLMTKMLSGNNNNYESIHI